jgi:hypothetical protein
MRSPRAARVSSVKKEQPVSRILCRTCGRGPAAEEGGYDAEDRPLRYCLECLPISSVKARLARVGGPILESMVVAVFARRLAEVGKGVYEARFDGRAGCLRIASGGSSRQNLLEIQGASIRSRLLSPRECGRLQGLPDSSKLPTKTNDALTSCGDAVCAAVVAFLEQCLLTPILNSQSARSGELAFEEQRS